VSPAEAAEAAPAEDPVAVPPPVAATEHQVSESAVEALPSHTAEPLSPEAVPEKVSAIAEQALLGAATEMVQEADTSAAPRTNPEQTESTAPEESENPIPEVQKPPADTLQEATENKKD